VYSVGLSFERPHIAEVIHLAVPAADAANKIDIFMDRDVVGYVTVDSRSQCTLVAINMNSMEKCVCLLKLPGGKVSSLVDQITGTIADIAGQILRVC
jgi:hypothetical protein